MTWCFRYRLIYQPERGDRVVRCCWVNFQSRGVLLIWIIVWQGSTALAVGAEGVIWTGHFFLSSISFNFFFRLSGRRPDIDWHCLKGPISPKQPTIQSARDSNIGPMICISQLYTFRDAEAGWVVLCPVSGRPTNLDNSKARAYCACSRWGWRLFGHFFSHLSFLTSVSLSLGDGRI